MACNAVPECEKRRNAFKKAVQRFNISAGTISWTRPFCSLIFVF
ncbi:hypothetical protein HMPREF0542_11826 [Ligilactobacillus ruminis ATCC 25644]|uniref:Uncharacterized protein n=1 Tax=Ligilactobacillus ruminis ATCC 25644 TaxID=525362 RepID=E7FSE9_9LACO|nr:hypothetical protein HMPREF0542_11826 [Ligilactobacillus ruminis ATCC 25644]EGX98861.1 hypothetical protein ANHS_570 [Ligilactobacillus ruminis ATCC 25644]MBT9627950.1 alginate lyase [Ligilactobacillus ruminis]